MIVAKLHTAIESYRWSTSYNIGKNVIATFLYFTLNMVMEYILYYFPCQVSYMSLLAALILKIYNKSFLEKLDKHNRLFVKSYKIINLYNCFGKVVEKLVIKKLSQFYKAKRSLYQEQIVRKKHESDIDIAVFMNHIRS